MDMIERNNCCITGANDLEELIRIKDFPIFSSCVEEVQEKDLFQDMVWKISRSSGCVQLCRLVPEEILYSKGHGSGSVGGIWKRHHKAFADFIRQYKPERVFEIGGGHGILAREYAQADSWVILEPDPRPEEGTPAKYIKGFFGSGFIYNDKFDAVVHSHTFEHMYHPCDFMQNLRDFMQDGCLLIFSLPNIQRWTENFYSNNLSWEHTIILTEPYIDYMLAKYGFRLLKKEYFGDHSIFYSAVRDDSIVPIVIPDGLYERNRKMFMDYIRYFSDICKELNIKMSKLDREVYLFGGHVFSQLMFAMGLQAERIKMILDNDRNKQGKRLYGTRFKVFSPKELKDEDKPYVIVKAGAYTDEIKTDILENINSETVFLD